MVKENHKNKSKVPTLLNMELRKKLNENAEKDLKNLLEKLNEISFSHLEIIQEEMVKNKFFYIFYDRLQEMANIFAEKNKIILDRYKHIKQSNKSRLQSEILIQQKFLEYADDIEILIKDIDKDLLNIEENFNGKINFFLILIFT